MLDIRKLSRLCWFIGCESRRREGWNNSSQSVSPTRSPQHGYTVFSITFFSSCKLHSQRHWTWANEGTACPLESKGSQGTCLRWSIKLCTFKLENQRDTTRQFVRSRNRKFFFLNIFLLISFLIMGTLKHMKKSHRLVKGTSCMQICIFYFHFTLLILFHAFL